MFNNRKDAGEQLAKLLKKYRGKDVIVLAIPRGGVEVGYYVAKYLGAEFSLVISRKLQFPDNPEAGFGAIAEDGSTFLLEGAKKWLSQKQINDAISYQKEEIKRRVAVLRKGKPMPDISGKTVILVDDGLAMGSTMRAAIMLCRKRKAGKIVVAAPVSGIDVAKALERIADEVIVVEKPLIFNAVADSYREWHDASDEEVIRIMSKTRKLRPGKE